MKRMQFPLFSPLALAMSCAGLLLTSVAAQAAQPVDAATVMRAAVAKAQAFNAAQPATQAASKLRRNALRNETTETTVTPADDPEDVIPDDAPADPFAGEPHDVTADQPLELDNQGQIDGIYRCTYNFGSKEQSAYVSVNGKRDGQSIFVVADVAENTLGVNGWGAGVARDDGEGGYVFAGTTDTQLPFSFVVTVAADGSASAEGWVGMTFKGEDYLGELSCKSIW